MFVSTQDDRAWLSWVLDLAEDAMLAEPDEFGGSDWAALGRWKSVAEGSWDGVGVR